MIEIKLHVAGNGSNPLDGLNGDQVEAVKTLLGLNAMTEPAKKTPKESEEPEKKSRKRRTKAEIEAEKVAADEIDNDDDFDDDEPEGDDDDGELFDYDEPEGDDDELDTSDPKHMSYLNDLLSEVVSDANTKKKVSVIMAKKVKAKSTKNLTDKQKQILWEELKKIQS